MSRTSRHKRRSSRRKLAVQKPGGVLHPRVEKVGPDRFGVACLDCHKAASKWLLANFHGKVLAELLENWKYRPSGRPDAADVAVV